MVLSQVALGRMPNDADSDPRRQKPSSSRARRRWLVGLGAFLVCIVGIVGTYHWWLGGDGIESPRRGHLVDPVSLYSCLEQSGEKSLTDYGYPKQPDKRLGHFGFDHGGTVEFVVLPSNGAASEFLKLFPSKDVVDRKVVRRHGNVVIRTNDGSMQAAPTKHRRAVVNRCLRSPTVAHFADGGDSDFETCSEIDNETAKGYLVSGISCDAGRKLADTDPEKRNRHGYGTTGMGVCCSISAELVADGDRLVVYQTG